MSINKARSPRGLSAEENETCMEACADAGISDASELFFFCLGFRNGIQQKDELMAQAMKLYNFIGRTSVSEGLDTSKAIDILAEFDKWRSERE